MMIMYGNRYYFVDWLLSTVLVVNAVNENDEGTKNFVLITLKQKLKLQDDARRIWTENSKRERRKTFSLVGCQRSEKKTNYNSDKKHTQIVYSNHLSRTF